MKTKFTIYTEDVLKNREYILKAVSQKYEGFTVMYGHGYWKGEAENNMIIEIIAFPPNNHALLKERDKVNNLAYHIKVINKQESVLVTETAIKGGLI